VTRCAELTVLALDAHALGKYSNALPSSSLCE
jgi:hypothetical protein